jgi:hypothetical protein
LGVHPAANDPAGRGDGAALGGHWTVTTNRGLSTGDPADGFLISYDEKEVQLIDDHRGTPATVCSPSAPLRQIEGLHGGRISGSS